MPRREARTDGSQPCVIRRDSAVEGEYGVWGGLRSMVQWNGYVCLASAVYWQHIALLPLFTVIVHVNVMSMSCQMP